MPTKYILLGCDFWDGTVSYNFPICSLYRIFDDRKSTYSRISGSIANDKSWRCTESTQVSHTHIPITHTHLSTATWVILINFQISANLWPMNDYFYCNEISKYFFSIQTMKNHLNFNHFANLLNLIAKKYTIPCILCNKLECTTQTNNVWFFFLCGKRQLWYSTRFGSVRFDPCN